MDKKLKMSVGIGGPSIIMIFVVLCLTTLAALSLMTANADWKLTKKATEAVTGYYSADSKAEEILASADASLSAGQALETSSFTIPATATQDLVMVLKVNGSRYTVTHRTLVPKSQWDYDQYKTEFDDTIVE
ncbi:MAG TPA: hypothetical protein PKA19_14330 [Bacillota bacterium]|nr:hypothetical protein [Bacillota bacterium]